jgi:hypothetical protein
MNLKNIDYKAVLIKNKRTVIMWGIICIVLIMSLVLRPKPRVPAAAAIDTNNVLCTLSIPKPKFAEIQSAAQKAGLSPVAYLITCFNRQDTTKK